MMEGLKLVAEKDTSRKKRSSNCGGVEWISTRSYPV